MQAFNGSLPGPTLRVAPGDTIRVAMTNGLEAPTNLHVHGLHVSPEGNGDNPFVSIAPGESFDYEFVLPADHPPGTYWYHPHRHGHVADRVAAGLYGAIIVEDPEPVPVTRERVMVVSDLTPGRLRQPGRGRPDAADDGPGRRGRTGQRPGPPAAHRRPGGAGAVADRQRLPLPVPPAAVGRPAGPAAQPRPRAPAGPRGDHRGGHRPRQPHRTPRGHRRGLFSPGRRTGEPRRHGRHDGRGHDGRDHDG
uniref:multicopper oxidase domain-containing protein n=1 Tax=Janibacter limosus TaxID=53458 RepID=UPI0035D9BC42